MNLVDDLPLLELLPDRPTSSRWASSVRGGSGTGIAAMPPSLDFRPPPPGEDGAGMPIGHWSSASSRTVRIGGEACFPGCFQSKDRLLVRARGVVRRPPPGEQRRHGDQVHLVLGEVNAGLAQHPGDAGAQLARHPVTDLLRRPDLELEVQRAVPEAGEERERPGDFSTSGCAPATWSSSSRPARVRPLSATATSMSVRRRLSESVQLVTSLEMR